jgi:hypothetical protein
VRGRFAVANHYHLIFLLVCAATQALATPQDDLKRARNHFEYGEYDKAAALVRTLTGQLAAEGDLIEAYRILGLAEFYRGRMDDARAALVRMLSIDPDYQMDAFFVPPAAVAFFDGVKKDNALLLGPIRERKLRAAEEKRLEEEARRTLLSEEDRRRHEREDKQKEVTPSIERRIVLHPYVVNWFPLGAGQFQNGDNYKGAVLAASEGVAAAVSVLAYVIVGALRKPNGLYDEGPGKVAQGANVVSVASGWICLALYGFGVWDAHQSWQPQLVIEERAPDRPAEAAAGP